MTPEELIDRVKVLPKAKARSQVIRWALMAIVGPDVQGQTLYNLYRRRLRAKIKKSIQKRIVPLRCCELRSRRTLGGSFNGWVVE